MDKVDNWFEHQQHEFIRNHFALFPVPGVVRGINSSRVLYQIKKKGHKHNTKLALLSPPMDLERNIFQESSIVKKIAIESNGLLEMGVAFLNEDCLVMTFPVAHTAFVYIISQKKLVESQKIEKEGTIARKPLVYKKDKFCLFVNDKIIFYKWDQNNEKVHEKKRVTLKLKENIISKMAGCGRTIVLGINSSQNSPFLNELWMTGDAHGGLHFFDRKAMHVTHSITQLHNCNFCLSVLSRRNQ